jgi:hypothetical protein
MGSGGGDRATLMAKLNISSDFFDIFSEMNAFIRTLFEKKLVRPIE